MLVEKAGGKVIIEPASAENLKVTTPTDLRLAELLLRSGESGARAEPDKRGRLIEPPDSATRRSVLNRTVLPIGAAALVAGASPAAAPTSAPPAKPIWPKARAVPKFAAPRAAAMAALAAKAARSVRTSTAVPDTRCVRHLRAHRLSRAPAPGRSREHAEPSGSSRRKTSTATSRPPREAGIDELGVSEHIYRFAQALDDLGPPVLGASRRGRPRRLLRVRPRPRRSASASRWTSSRAGGPHREPARAARLRLRGRLGPLRRRRAVDDAGYDIWDGAGDADAIWRRYFETARRGGALRPLRHPRPPRPGEGMGHGPAAARPRSALLLRARGRGDRRVRHRRRGLDRRLRKPVGELYPAPAFAEMCIEAGAGFALSSDAHVPEQIGFEYEQAVETHARAGGSARSRSSSAASAPGAARMMALDGSASAMTPSASREGRRLVLGGVEIEHEQGLEGHSDADVAHARGHRRACSAPPGSATSAPISRRRGSLARRATRSTSYATVLGQLPGAVAERGRDGHLRGAPARPSTAPRWSAASARPSRRR